MVEEGELKRREETEWVCEGACNQLTRKYVTCLHSRSWPCKVSTAGAMSILSHPFPSHALLVSSPSADGVAD